MKRTYRLVRTRKHPPVRMGRRRTRKKQPPMRGYQYHPPKKRWRDKLREIVRIIRE